MRDSTATPGQRFLASRSCLLIALAAIAGCSASATSLPRQSAPAAAVTSTPTPTPTPTPSGWELSPGESLIAVAKHSSVGVRTRPSGPVRWRLGNPNSSGAPLIFLVLAQSGGGWTVRVPARPNGALGWIADGDV